MRRRRLCRDPPGRTPSPPECCARCSPTGCHRRPDGERACSDPRLLEHHRHLCRGVRIQPEKRRQHPPTEVVVSATRSRLAARALALSAAGAMVLAGCGGDDEEPDTAAGSEPAEPAESVELSFAHSYSTQHAHHVCGAQVVADELAENGSGIDMQIFPSSQLGADGPDRVSAVASGDISVDIQGNSAISALYEPIGALDAAYAFDGPDHLFEFVDSPAFDEMAADMLEETGVRILDVWYFGMRHFTA